MTALDANPHQTNHPNNPTHAPWSRLVNPPSHAPTPKYNPRGCFVGDQVTRALSSAITRITKAPRHEPPDRGHPTYWLVRRRFDQPRLTPRDGYAGYG